MMKVFTSSTPLANFAENILVIILFFFQKKKKKSFSINIYNIYDSSQAPSSTTADGILGPVVQSVVSLTSSLRVISLTVLADSIYSFLKFFAEKM